LETFSWAEGVNVASYIGCHYIDLINYLISSAKPLELSAVPVKGPVFSSRKIFDAILITIKYDVDGREVIFTMNVGWSNPLGAPAKSIQNIDLLFENGRYVVDQAHRGFEVWSDQSISFVNPDFFQNTFIPSMNINAYDGYGYTSISLFLDSIFKGDADFSISANPSLPLVQNVYQVELITDAIKESLNHQSKWVSLCN
jgi:predicted dehydrogenase